MGEWESKAYRPHPPKNKQARKGEGGGTARRVRSRKTSGSRALRRAYYRKGLEHALEVVETALRTWERRLEEKHKLLGHPVVEERIRYMPFMRESAEVARVRMVVVSEIERLIHHDNEGAEKQ